LRFLLRLVKTHVKNNRTHLAAQQV
jgi:hypothetical protein